MEDLKLWLRQVWNTVHDKVIFYSLAAGHWVHGLTWQEAVEEAAAHIQVLRADRHAAWLDEMQSHKSEVHRTQIKFVAEHREIWLAELAQTAQEKNLECLQALKAQVAGIRRLSSNCGVPPAWQLEDFLDELDRELDKAEKALSSPNQ
jgi:hypothetical protein